MAANVGHGHDIGLDVGVDCRKFRGASSSLGTREPLAVSGCPPSPSESSGVKEGYVRNPAGRIWGV